MDISGSREYGPCPSDASSLLEGNRPTAAGGKERGGESPKALE